MRLLDKIQKKMGRLSEEIASKSPENDPAPKNKAGSESGFLDAVRKEIGTPREGDSPPHEVTVEELYQDLMQRKQKGEMPRNPSEALMDALGRRPASEVFSSGAVFELSRLYRDHFLKALQASDDRKLFNLFRALYSLFLDQPEIAGFTEAMINKKNEDTDPLKWVVSCASVPGGSVALCRMPIQNKLLSARLVGIIFSDSGDGYYSCMLNKNGSVPSEIIRNNGSLPSANAGAVTGTDSEVMSRFLDCIRKQWNG